MSSPEVFPLESCSIAIKAADDPKLGRCLDSIDDPTVSINAVITPSKQNQELLEERGIPYSVTTYGNIARSAQLSVEQAEHDNVIVMDSDAFFAPGSVTALRKALQHNPIAKPNLHFYDDGSRMSQLIAASRQRFADRPEHVTNPGLAIQRDAITEACGYIFNPRIRWTEDADLNYRLKDTPLNVTHVREATVLHDPVTMKHELRCAFLYGVGKRLSVEHTPGRPSSEELSLVLGGLLKEGIVRRLRSMYLERGVDGTLFDIAWRAIYLAGYHSQKTTGRWSADQ